MCYNGVTPKERVTPTTKGFKVNEMIKMNSVSRHASQERINRLTLLIETLGLDDEGFILETRNDLAHNNGTTSCLTSTGIIIIKNTNNGNLVTGYMATERQVMGMYRSAGYKKVPDKIMRTVRRNNKKYAFLLDIKE